MDTRKMIDKYLDERMSHDEEQEFLCYLRNTKLSKEYRDEKELILQMAAMQEPAEPPTGMEERLTAMIDNLAQDSAPDKRVRRLELRHIWRAAIVVAIVAATGLAIVWQSNSEYNALMAARDKDTFVTPEEALPHANVILRELATTMNATRNNVAKVGSDIKKMSLIIKHNQQ